MIGFLILLFFLVAGMFAQQTLSLPIPASIAGMLLLLTFLLLRGSVPQSLRQTTQFLAPWLPMFLVPVSVGIVMHKQLLADHGLMLLMILTVSLIPGVLVCAACMHIGVAAKVAAKEGNARGENDQ